MSEKLNALEEAEKNAADWSNHENYTIADEAKALKEHLKKVQADNRMLLGLLNAGIKDAIMIRQALKAWLMLHEDRDYLMENSKENVDILVETTKRMVSFNGLE